MRRLLTLLAVPVAALCAVGAASGSTAGGDVSPRVVGPDRADAIAAEWPFATLLNPGYAYLCGGSVISSRWVLTAGHCLYDGSGNLLSAFPAYPGAYNRNALPAGQLADAALEHPSYSPAGNPWDFALLRMPAPISATPVALPAPSEDSAVDALRTAVPATGPRNGRIAGWGLTTNGGSTSTILQHTAGGVPLLDDAVCAGGGSYGSAFQPATMVCAGGYPDPLGPPAPDDANDTCQGDSGGPLFMDLGAGDVVAGITSGGNNPTCLQNDHSFDVNV
ncbi:MAG: S1 family peptidase, partial [Miltoncostaeaceae bacterium]